jgi:DNA-binding NarL/FixJ family response regulator
MIYHLLLADDHALVREGLKQFFALTTDIRVESEATNGAQVLEVLRQKKFDLVLLDMSMPGISGPDLIARIRAQEAPPPVLVLSMHNESQIARRALAAGATGYLTKDNNPEVLLAAVRRVAAGGRYLDAVLAEVMAFENTAAVKTRPRHETLSDRELQVFNLLARGVGVNQISQELSISNKTVSTHKARLMEKLGLATIADIVRYAVTHALLD